MLPSFSSSHRSQPSAPPKNGNNNTSRPEIQVNAQPVLERNSTTSSPNNNSSSDMVMAPQPSGQNNFGYGTNYERRYTFEKELARGGNGVVHLVKDNETGQQFAIKSIPKVLTDPRLSEKKILEHKDAIKREVEVMKRLRSCLNVASLEEVYEDDSHVHLVMEYCAGGELHHVIGTRHYSERTVASYMRAVLRTLAQCHAQKILHRDIKPGNFLLSSSSERAPLKAIDFGLAVFYDDKSLPQTDLGLEGTPWFMAPETLRSEVWPASDVWAAGIMAAELLTGRFPFDDRSSPFSPSLTKVWKSILCDELDLSKREWEGVSDEAKDFVKMLLVKDPKQRPTAKQALRHPWLSGAIEERSQGKPLSLAVVQRIQRYGQGSLFKRSVLEFIAAELLSEAQHIDGTTTSAGSSQEMSMDEQENVCPLHTGGAAPIITHALSSPLQYLYTRLSMVDKELIDREALANGLAELGYRLTPAELERLLDQLDPGNTGKVAKSQLAASQIDWSVLQTNQTERWLELARRAFSELDTDKDGVLSSEDLMALLRHKLPPAQIEAAVRHALAEAARKKEGSRSGSNDNTIDASVHSVEGSVGGNGGGDSQHGPGMDSIKGGLNFRQFIRMLHVGSADSLDLFDDRLGGSLGSPGSWEKLSQLDKILEKSVKGGDLFAKDQRGNSLLEPVHETD